MSFAFSFKLGNEIRHSIPPMKIKTFFISKIYFQKKCLSSRFIKFFFLFFKLLVTYPLIALYDVYELLHYIFETYMNLLKRSYICTKVSDSESKFSSTNMF